jgi:hypothetical protein
MLGIKTKTFASANSGPRQIRRRPTKSTKSDPKRTWNPRLIWRKALARKAAYPEQRPGPPGVALFRDATCLAEGGRNEQHEKNVSDPKLVVARHGACQRRGIGGNQTRSDDLFL